jgi:cytoskeletal protein CcmA (bactofilin family)
LRCTGNFHGAGSVIARRFRLQGEATIDGQLEAAELAALGQVEVKGSVRGGRMTVRGQFTAAGACEADRLTVKGAFSIGGLLNAESVEIRLYGPCEAREIGGGRIDVRRNAFQTVKQLFRPQGAAALRAGSIEGDDIYLEHTHADVVRGKRVELGPGCTIGLVEYSETLKCSKGATVEREVKR